VYCWQPQAGLLLEDGDSARLRKDGITGGAERTAAEVWSRVEFAIVRCQRCGAKRPPAG